MDAISVMVGFYLGTKASELNDSATEDDDEGDDDDDEEVVTILPEDKYRVGSLEKMISVMAVLVEESRCERDFHSFSKPLKTASTCATQRT
ncbi:ubiquitin carboxyl-terminal hydrolase 34-like [Porites lutea]|uniref:ubiquitin carboxyl-terminal hydrolase 34-like n=1 Tax=Porites lutea TaxID=51062 RepID=UPI003CC6B2B7